MIILLFVPSVIDVGFERAMYSTTEGDDSVEVCFTVGHEDSGIILDTTLMFRIFTTSGDALGKLSRLGTSVFQNMPFTLA